MAIDVGQAVAYLTLDISKFRSGMADAMSSLQSFESSSSTLSSKLSSFGSSLSTVGSTLTKTVTVPIVGLGTAATKVAGDFDEAMSKVEAISGATADQMSDLRDKAIEMGAKTKFSAKESADAFTYMAMAGWDAKQMIAGISGIMSLAAADGLDLATTSDIVTDALTAFGLEAGDAGHFADVLAQASSSANTNVSMLGESFKYVAPVAGSLNMSVEDVAIALGLMANSGIKSTQAGTALRTALTNLVKPTDAMATKMEELGIEVTNSDGTMKSLREIMDILRDKFSTLSEAEQASAAATIFGKEAMSGMLAIINTSQKDYDSLADSIDNCKGRADGMAETMMDNLPGAIEQMKGAIESLMIKLGEALVPTIRKITEFITSLVEKLNSLSDEQIQQIVQIAAVVAAVGPALLIIGKVISAVTSIIGVVKNLFTIGSALVNGIQLLAGFISGTLIPAIAAIGWPVLAVIAVIGALIAAGVALYKNWDEVSAWAERTWSSIKESVKGAVDGIKEFFASLGQAIGDVVSSIGEWLSNLWSTIGDFFSNLLSGVSNWLTNLWSSVSSFLDTLFSIASHIGEFFGKIISAVTEFWSTLFTNIGEALSKIISSIVEFGTHIISQAVEIGTKFVSAFARGFTNLVSSITGFITNVVDVLTQWGSSLLSLASDIGSKFVGAITSNVTKVGNFFADIFSDILDTVTSLLPKMVEAGGKIITNLWEGMKKAFTAVVKWMTDSLSTLFKPLTDLLDKIFGPVKNLFSGIASFVSGSHANGLDYVPYDGYVAQLHQGERVLTKQENQEYNNGNGGGGNGSGDTYNFYNTKPDPYEYARQMKRVKKELELDKK